MTAKSSIWKRLAVGIAVLAISNGWAAAQNLGTSPIVLEDPEPEARAGFGRDVAIGDVNGDGYLDVIASAAASDVDTDTGPMSLAGEAFVFLGPDLTTVLTLADPTPAVGNSLGNRIAIGDVDGNGVEDVIVNSISDVITGAGTVIAAGEVLVFLGPGLSSILRLREPIPERDAAFGSTLAIGDVDHDGTADVIVGVASADASSAAGGLVNAGEVFVFLGPDLTRVILLQDPVPTDNAFFGRGLATGDVNGDSFDDVIVGAHNADIDPGTGVLEHAGKAFVFLGPDLTRVIPLLDPDPEAEASFGFSAAAGDVDGDGTDDVVIGAADSIVDPGTGGLEGAGEAFVFLGPDLTSVIPLRDPQPQEFSFFGSHAETGDINDDGAEDVIVTVFSDLDSENGALQSAGTVHVFLGPDLSRSLHLVDPEPEDRAVFGNSLAAEDINGDGRADVAVGAVFSNIETVGGFVLEHAGQAFLFLSTNDLDGDGVPDELDPDPLDDDVDNDGIPDGSDPDTVMDAVTELPLGVFANSADPAGQRNAMQSRLEDAEMAIASGDTAGAIRILRNLLRHVDGCPEDAMAGESADINDWIIDCDSQREVRLLIEVLIENLSAS